MENSPHILMAGPGAENFARKTGIRLVRPEEWSPKRARERWRARKQQAGMLESQARARAAIGHGTVGAVAVDVHGAMRPQLPPVACRANSLDASETPR